MKHVQLLSNLAQLTGSFAEVCRECYNSQLQIESEVRQEWRVTDSLKGVFDYTLAMGCASDQLQGLLYFGIPGSSLEAFTGQPDMSTEDVLDMFGELANIYLGMLSDVPKIKETIGVLIQTLPVVCKDGELFLPFMQGVEGKLWAKDQSVYAGIALKSVTKK